jgi:hypothetical protein
MPDAPVSQPDPPAQPAEPEAEDQVVIDETLFNKIKFKPNKGQYIFVPKNVLGDSADT